MEADNFRLLVQQHCDVLGADIAHHSLRLWRRPQTFCIVMPLQMPSHRLAGLRSKAGLRPEWVIDLRLPGLSWRKPAMWRAASSAARPHMPTPPRPPALLTAAARDGVVIIPMGARMIGNLRFSRSVRGFDGHITPSRA